MILVLTLASRRDVPELKTMESSARVLKEKQGQTESKSPDTNASSSNGGKGAPSLAAPTFAGARQEMPAEGTEIDSGNPLLKKFVDEKGQLVREILNTPQGMPLTDTVYADGQKTMVEKSYGEDGMLMRVRRFQNDRLVDTQVLR